MAEINGIGKRIRELREKMEFTQAELAARVNRSSFAPEVTQAQISNIETGGGRHLPSTRLLAALAEVLETNPAYLLGIVNDSAPPSDLEDQVVVPVYDARRKAQLQELTKTLADVPETDFVLVSTIVHRLVPPKSNPKRRHKRMTAASTKPDERKHEELESDIFASLHKLRTWGGIEFGDELADDLAAAALATNDAEFTRRFDVLRQHVQNIREHLQMGYGGAAEDGS
jgi:Predicted transcriptional regulators